MIRTTAFTVVATLFAAPVFSGGIERSPQSIDVIFEEGRFFQFGLGFASPNVSGTVGGGALSSGDMAPSFETLNFVFKTEITEKIDAALIFQDSFGADVDYTGSDPGFPLLGTEATVDGSDIVAVARYKFNDNISVFGGGRLQTIGASLTGLPTPGGLYDLDVDRTYEFGYLVGAAYEVPEIALRVAVTYNSSIDHNFETTESFNGVVIPTPDFSSTIPQSVNLEFQSGIAENTLLFGSVRWQDWSAFDIVPAGLGGAELINYESDYYTFRLGLGRRFNENWSGAVTSGYEPSTGDIQGNLAPRDGFKSVGLAATYTVGNTEITSGIRYVELGDATTQTINGDFSGNDAVLFGVRLRQRF